MAGFGFRIRFHVEPNRRFASDENPVTLGDGATLRGLDVEKMADATRFALRIDGFASEAAAKGEAQRWSDAIAIAGARLQVGFDIGRFVRTKSVVLAPGLAMLERDHGGAIIARNDLHGVDVFRVDDTRPTRFASLNANAYATSQISRLVDGLRASLPNASLPQKLRLALDLLGVSGFEPSPHVRFLILVSAFEVLAERRPASGAALKRIARWQKSTARNSDAGIQLLHERLRELKRVDWGGMSPPGRGPSRGGAGEGVQDALRDSEHARA